MTLLRQGQDTGAGAASGNWLLGSLGTEERALLSPYFYRIELGRGRVLMEPGEDVHTTYFPHLGCTISLELLMQDGRSIEAATIGREGAVGGIVSGGQKPAFARAAVQLAGLATALDTSHLEEAKRRSSSLADLFARYADALLAQVMQQVACNALHALDARCARWLLVTHDRVGEGEIRLTQQDMSEMLGVQRTTISTVTKAFQDRGLILARRGAITIANRPLLEQVACECYSAVEDHYDLVMPRRRPIPPKGDRQGEDP